MNLSEALVREDNWTQTENGADALKSTGSRLVDFYASLGSYRKESASRLTADFDLAFQENPLVATKLLFYGRDIRKGVGERLMFRTILTHMGNHYTDTVVNNLPCIAFFGRFDDLYALVGTKAEKAMWEYMHSVWEADVVAMDKNQPISLLAKWIKSPDSSSVTTRKLGTKTLVKLGYSTGKKAVYVKQLRALRAYLDIVERHITFGTLGDVDYSKVPGKAMLKYKNLFLKKDEQRFTSYLDSLSKGETKMNTSVVTPVEVVDKYVDFSKRLGTITCDETVELMWKNLPNFFEGYENTNNLVICDTSGSMYEYGCLNVALALTIYAAEHNTGMFKDKFITFSNRPTLQSLEGVTLLQRLMNLSNADWNNNTDLLASFKLILDTAVKYKLSQKDIPTSVTIVSDMQFDTAISSTRTDYTELIKKMFADNGYEAPSLIYWNVRNSKTCFHATHDSSGVQLASGKSAAVFAQVCKAMCMTPYEAMLLTVNNDRYDIVQL